jgi:hypothetical protein
MEILSLQIKHKLSHSQQHKNIRLSTKELKQSRCTYGGAWGRGCIAPTHSRPRHWMGWVVSVTPRWKDPNTHCTGGWVGPRTGLDTETGGKIFCFCRGSNLDRPVVQPVARHYTGWATLLTVSPLLFKNSTFSLHFMRFDSHCFYIVYI